MASNLDEERIRHHAYLLWEADGRPHGCDEHYWHLAASHLRDGTTPSAFGVATREIVPTNPGNVTVVEPRQAESGRPRKTSGKTPAGAPEDSAQRTQKRPSTTKASAKTAAPVRKLAAGTRKQTKEVSWVAGDGKGLRS